MLALETVSVAVAAGNLYSVEVSAQFSATQLGPVAPIYSASCGFDFVLLAVSDY